MLRKYTFFFIFFFLLTGIIIYSNTFHSAFLFDDHATIVDNILIKDNSIFTQFNLPRYIGLITFALNYKFNHLNPYGYHIINTLIHIVNAILVYFLVRILLQLTPGNKNDFKEYALPFAAALIFLVHPIQTQAVTYITQRFTSLATFFTLLSVLLYIKFRKAPHILYRYFIASLICTLLAYKTKENTATLPFAILIVEYIFLKIFTITTKRKLLYILPYFVLLIFILIPHINQNRTSDDLLLKVTQSTKETTMVTRTQYLLTEQRVIIKYIRLLILPINQCAVDYYNLSYSLFEPKVLASIFIVALLILAAYKTIKILPLFSFGIFWFFNFLLVESSIIPIRDIIFEHRIYLPSIGFIIALISFIDFIFLKLKFNRGILFLIMISIVLSVATYMRNAVWKDDISLWKDAIAKYPENMKIHTFLGSGLAQKGFYDEAIKELQLSLGYNPDDDPEIHKILSYCYARKGSKSTAINEINTAIQMEPKNLTYYSTAATIYFDYMDYHAALSILNKAYAITKSNPQINKLLGRAYCGLGDLNTALIYYNNAIKLDSKEADFYIDKGLCFLNFRKNIESRTEFVKATEIPNSSVDSYFYIGITYEFEGDLQQAAYYFQEFISRTSKENALYLTAMSHLNNIK